MTEELWNYRAELIRVVDGDTLDLHVDLGFRVYKRIRARLAGVDTPEVYGVKQDSEEYQQGLAASAFVNAWFEQHGKQVFISTEKATGKYGRWIATVTALDGANLNEALKAQGW